MRAQSPLLVWHDLQIRHCTECCLASYPSSLSPTPVHRYTQNVLCSPCTWPTATTRTPLSATDPDSPFLERCAEIWGIMQSRLMYSGSWSLSCTWHNVLQLYNEQYLSRQMPLLRDRSEVEFDNVTVITGPLVLRFMFRNIFYVTIEWKENVYSVKGLIIFSERDGSWLSRYVTRVVRWT